MEDPRLEIRKPLDELELAVLERDLARPGEVSAELLGALRYVLSFARLTTFTGADGRTVDVSGALSAHRWRVIEALRPHLAQDATLWGAIRVLPSLVAATREQRARLLARGDIDRAALEEEICTRQLVVVCGGGGGSGYGYAGAYALLHRHRLQPALLAGTSMGGLMGLFRARHFGFDGGTLMAAARRLSWNTVFRVKKDAPSIYGLPASLRLYLRGAIGHLFQDGGGHALTFRELPVPLLIVATGLTVGGLKHDLDYFEHFLDEAVDVRQILKPSAMMRLGKLASIAREMIGEPETLREIVFGGDPLTLDADVLDAAGFSAAVTGLIHYDIYRDDARMKRLLDRLYAEVGLTRLTEGGLVNNVPARPAFQHVMNGNVGGRNPFILAIDCFSPQRRNVLMYPLQQIARMNVVKNIPYANLYIPLQRRLSPLNLLPPPEHLVQAMRWTMEELEPKMPLVKAACERIPVLRESGAR